MLVDQLKVIKIFYGRFTLWFTTSSPFPRSCFAKQSGLPFMKTLCGFGQLWMKNISLALAFLKAYFREAMAISTALPHSFPNRMWCTSSPWPWLKLMYSPTLDTTIPCVTFQVQTGNIPLEWKGNGKNSSQKRDWTIWELWTVKQSKRKITDRPPMVINHLSSPGKAQAFSGLYFFK